MTANVVTFTDTSDTTTGYAYEATDQDAEDVNTDDTSTTLSNTVKKVKLSLSGDDASHFTLDQVSDTGRYEVRFKTNKPNFEAPMDANKDNKYKVSIVATDQAGLTGTKSLTITVGNASEDGSIELSTNQPAVGFPITATLKDGDTGQTGMKWQWQNSSDGTNFVNIFGAKSATYTPKGATADDPATALVDESDPGDEGKFLRVTVTYRDDASPNADVNAEVDSVNAVRVEPNVNSAPVFASGITLSVAENTEADGTVDGPVRATDPDGDALTYTLTGGADMGSFKVDSDGQIRVKKGTMLDYEGSQTTYTIEVTATDPFNASASATVTITVTDVNEAPTVGIGPGSTPPSPGVVGGRASVSVQEGTTAVGTYTAPTAITNATWNLSGTDAGDFSISNGGALSFRTAPDFENPADSDTDNVYQVTVVASNGGGTSATLAVTVTVTDDPSDAAFDPLTYDADSSGAIERSEVIQAIRDYFADTISQADVRAVIRSYFSS